MAKLKTPLKETFFYRLIGTEHGSQPSLTTRDRELVSVLEVRIEPADLNPRPLTPQSVTLPTLPRAGHNFFLTSLLLCLKIYSVAMWAFLSYQLANSTGYNYQ